MYHCIMFCILYCWDQCCWPAALLHALCWNKWFCKANIFDISHQIGLSTNNNLAPNIWIEYATHIQQKYHIYPAKIQQLQILLSSSTSYYCRFQLPNIVKLIFSYFAMYNYVHIIFLKGGHKGSNEMAHLTPNFANFIPTFFLLFYSPNIFSHPLKLFFYYF